MTLAVAPLAPVIGPQSMSAKGAGAGAGGWVGLGAGSGAGFGPISLTAGAAVVATAAEVVAAGVEVAAAVVESLLLQPATAAVSNAPAARTAPYPSFTVCLLSDRKSLGWDAHRFPAESAGPNRSVIGASGEYAVRA